MNGPIRLDQLTLAHFIIQWTMHTMHCIVTIVSFCINYNHQCTLLLPEVNGVH